MKPTHFIIFLCMVAIAMANDALTIIKKEGHLDFTDGGSIYSLSANGDFSLMPVQMCGIGVTGGKWTEKNGEFIIIGQWVYINGESRGNDYRRMTMHISIFSDSSLLENQGKEIIRDGDRGFTVTKNVYFTIKDKTKIEYSEYRTEASKAPVQNFDAKFENASLNLRK